MRQFRPPWGRINEFVRKIIEGDPGLEPLNYNIIGWSLDTRDWDNLDADAIVHRVTTWHQLDGAIVLMHDGADRYYKRRGVPTVEATRRLVPWLVDRGLRLVTISDMLQQAT